MKYLKSISTHTEMDQFNIPDSPKLPQKEVETPTTKIPTELGALLDLDDEEDDDEMDIDTIISNKEKIPINNFEQFEHSDSLPENSEGEDELPENVLNSSIPKDSNYITPMMDFCDPIRAPIDSLNPFGENSTLLSSEPIPIILKDGLNIKNLNDLQIQKLNDYIDNKVMTIRRGFVKYLSSREDEENVGLEFNKLITQIDDIIEFIWYAMSQFKGIPTIYHANIIVDTSIETMFGNEFEDMKEVLNNSIKPPSMILITNDESNVKNLELPNNIDSSSFVSYYITIIGDLIDYIVKYDLNTFTDWILLLRLVAKLDNVLSIIIDYSSLKGNNLIITTEKIRIASIIQRTKIVLVGLFDKFLRSLGLEQIESHRKIIDNFQIYLGEAYEGLTDRTST